MKFKRFKINQTKVRRNKKDEIKYLNPDNEEQSFRT